MNNPLEATVGKPKIGGGVYVAPLGTALPTDAAAELNAAFVNVGFVSDEGVTNTITRDNTEIKAWGGDTVMNIQTGFNDQWKLKLLQVMNTAVMKPVFKAANVTGALESGVTVKVNSEELEAYVYVIDMIFNNNVLKRIVIPNAKVVELGDIVYVDGEPVNYDITLGCVPDDDGNTHYEYMKSAA